MVERQRGCWDANTNRENQGVEKQWENKSSREGEKQTEVEKRKQGVVARR